jgi:SAM-dependent methyltransferase
MLLKDSFDQGLLYMLKNIVRFCWHCCLFFLRYAYAFLACLYLFSIGCFFPRNRVLIHDVCSHFNFFGKLRMLRKKSKILIQDVELKEKLENEQFARYIMYLDIMDFVQKKTHQANFINPAIVEFGGSNGIIKLMFRNCAYEIADNYPRIDIQDLSGFKSDHYDFVILDQVLEHVANPAKAMQEVHRLLKKGGWLIVTTPFLVKIHYVPKDYWRFTKDGLRQLLLNYSEVMVKSWGNKEVVINHIKTGAWPTVKEFQKLGFFNLENDEDLPHVVWGYACK